MTEIIIMGDNLQRAHFFEDHPGEVSVTVRFIDDPIENFAGYWSDRIIVIGSITEDIRRVLIARSNSG